jgi:predicted HTH transcriptional regulator
VRVIAESSSIPRKKRNFKNPGYSGEIEAWGRGIQRIFQACRDAGTPELLVRYEPNDLWIEFPFAAEYLAAVRGGVIPATGAGLDEKSDKKLGQRRAAILCLVQPNPKITVTGLATSLGISRTAADCDAAGMPGFRPWDCRSISSIRSSRSCSVSAT